MSKHKGVHGIECVRTCVCECVLEGERNHGIVVFTLSRKRRPRLDAALVGRETYEKHKHEATHPQKNIAIVKARIKNIIKLRIYN